MIKKRQIRFIISSMSLLFVVLATIFVVLGLASYYNVIADADDVLEVLSENKGRFPIGSDKMNHKLPSDMSPETPYESRYFSVVLNAKDASVRYIETSRISAIDTSQALEYAQIALEDAKCGFVEKYRYMISEEEELLRIVFLDCGRALDAAHDFLFNSAVVIFVGYLVVFVLVTFFSQRIMRPIHESYEKQKRFITDAGHEIKTPLTIIQADVDVLELEIGENEWLEDIKRQAKRLSKLTQELVYLAKMEEAETTMQMLELSVSDVVSETASSFLGLAKAQGISFTCKIAPMLSMKGNEQAIGELVTILLDNALKYCTKEGEVSLSLEKQGKYIQMTVYNTTDYTMPTENLEVLFERFYRNDPSRNSQTGGHGIGLSIAQAIVNAHGGKIQARSKDGKSLEMTVFFPV